jgi:hypothetical protein
LLEFGGEFTAAINFAGGCVAGDVACVYILLGDAAKGVHIVWNWVK